MDRLKLPHYRSPVAVLFLLLTFWVGTAAAANSPPLISANPPPTATVGLGYGFTPTSSDPDGQTLTFGIANKPAWAVFNTVTGRLSGVPTAAATHSNIVISVSDGVAIATLRAFSITVGGSNRAPVISGTPATSAAIGQAYRFIPTASDPDGQTLTFSIANKPAWAVFNTLTGQLSGAPTVAATHSNIVISVSDGTARATLPAFSINVGGGNRAPVISGSPPTAVAVGQAYGFTPTASDPDGQALTFSIANKPAWAVFSATTGRLSGTPTAAATHSNIVISVSDGTANAILPSFAITVRSTNRAPVIGGTPPVSVPVGQAYRFIPTASDPDGQALTFSVANKPAWAVFNTVTGQLSGAPTVAGTHSNIVISVSDGTANAALPSFSITVGGSNRAPVISGTPPTSARVGQVYGFTPTASDPDGQALTFSIANKPAWAVFSTTNGRLSGTPTAAATHSNIVISVSDGSASATLPAFSLTVQSTNRAPVIGGTPPASVPVGQAYRFTPTASDPDGQTLTFGIANKPAWAVFNTVTGQLSGAPTVAATHSNIVISVSDGSASATLSPFSITVGGSNRAPVISGTAPTSAVVGRPYSFRPSASDPDGDPLTFSIANRPAWAQFDGTTGTLYGTPTVTGTHGNIVITVSDGRVTASLPAFSIAVTTATTASATLVWRAPTRNTDGTPLTGLSGYRVYYGTTPGQYGRSVLISSPSITSVVLENLTRGTRWYFAIKAINGTGVESAYSQEVSKAVL